jgi:hypothetical protein
MSNKEQINKGSIVGYKAFNSDWTCRGFQYEVGKTYKTEKQIEVCGNGFHFCKSPLDVLGYYGDTFNQKYAEIEARGDIKEEGDKSCTAEIKIIKELTYQELHAVQFQKILENIKTNKETTNTSGYESHSNTSGNYSHSNTSGYESISSSLGVNSRSRASKGWIVIVDWQQDKEYNWSIKDVHRAKVGKHKIKGELIKPNVWYWFEEGKLKSEI